MCSQVNILGQLLTLFVIHFPEFLLAEASGVWSQDKINLVPILSRLNDEVKMKLPVGM